MRGTIPVLQSEVVFTIHANSGGMAFSVRKKKGPTMETSRLLGSTPTLLW